MGAMPALLRQISVRHLWRAPLRSALVVCGIALGVAMFVATNAANRSIVSAFEEMIQRVAGRADLVVTGRGGSLPNELTAEVAQIDGVEHAAATVEIALRESAGGEPLLILGVDFLGDTHFLPFGVSTGEQRVVEDPLAFVNDATAILIAKSLAERRQLKVGDPLRLLTADGEKEFRVRGVLEDTGPAAAFGGQVAVMFIDAAQIAFARGNLVDRIDVAVKKGAQAADVRARIEQKLGTLAKVDVPGKKLERIERLLAPFRAGIALSGLIALIVAMFLIYNAVGIAVAQRRREIGILRSLGALRSTVAAQFCLEAVLMAIPGIAIGIVLARFIAILALQQQAATITRMYVPIRPPQPELSAELLIQAVLVALITTLIAAFWPARRAASVDPVESLRQRSSAGSTARIPGRLMLLGAALAVGCALFLANRGTRYSGAASVILAMLGSALVVPSAVIGLRFMFVRATERVFGIPGRIGLDSVERTLGRSALNVVALMIAVGMSVAIGGWLASFHENVRATVRSLAAGDIMVTAGSPVTDQYNVPFSPAALDKLRGLPGVAAVLPTRQLLQDIAGEELAVSAVDSQAYVSQLQRTGKMPELTAGAVAPKDLVDAPRLVINETAARRLGVSVGQSLELLAPSGKQRFEVRAVMIDYAQTPISYIDRKYCIKYWGDESIDIIDLVLADGANADETMAQVRQRLGSSEMLFVTKLKDMMDQITSMVDEAFAYSRSVELVALLVALLGVVSTMTAAVLDRAREIGTLRAIGATRAQVVRMVVVEAGFLGVVAAATGIGSGLLQGMLLLRIIEAMGIVTRLHYVVPGFDMLRIGVLVVITAALAGVLPGRRAARTDVKQALSYE